MAGFAGFSRALAGVAIRGRTLPGTARIGRQNVKSQDSYFNELLGPYRRPAALPPTGREATSVPSRRSGRTSRHRDCQGFTNR
jgi:hypothetical protein